MACTPKPERRGRVSRRENRKTSKRRLRWLADTADWGFGPMTIRREVARQVAELRRAEELPRSMKRMVKP